MKPRAHDCLGTLAVEVLVALLIGLGLVSLSVRGLLTLERARTRAAQRADAMTSVSVAHGVLRRELALGEPARDWSVAVDSVALRAYRGVGLVCREGSTPHLLLVRLAGDRNPDAVKDSVELIYDDGDIDVRALGASRIEEGPCEISSEAGALRALELTEPGPRLPVALRWFERGVYTVSDGALRYRRGAGGRQPLTAELWDDARSGFEVTGRVLRLVLVPADEAHGRAWAGFLAWVPPF